MIVIVFNYYEDWMYHKTVMFGYKSWYFINLVI